MNRHRAFAAQLAIANARGILEELRDAAEAEDDALALRRLARLGNELCSLSAHVLAARAGAVDAAREAEEPEPPRQWAEPRLPLDWRTA